MKKVAPKLQGAYRSLTVQINMLFLMLIASLPELILYLQDSAPMLKAYLGPDTYQHVMFVMGAVNIVLRFRTKLPLEAK